MSTQPEETLAYDPSTPDASEPQPLIETTEPAPEAAPEAAAPVAETPVEAGPPKPGMFSSLLGAIGKSSIYTWMLVLAFFAVTTAVVLLALELKVYDFDIKAKRAPTVSPPAAYTPAK